MLNPNDRVWLGSAIFFQLKSPKLDKSESK